MLSQAVCNNNNNYTIVQTADYRGGHGGISGLLWLLAAPAYDV